MLFRQRFQRAIGFTVILHKYQVPDLHNLGVVPVYQIGTRIGIALGFRANEFGAGIEGIEIGGPLIHGLSKESKKEQDGQTDDCAVGKERLSVLVEFALLDDMPGKEFYGTGRVVLPLKLDS